MRKLCLGPDSWLLFAIVVLFHCPTQLQADGALYHASSLRPLREKEQMAAIFFRDGRQKMVIALNFDVETTDSALWVFPVPGTPNQTKVDVIDTFPRFMGPDVRDGAAFRIHANMTFVRATQIYPLPFDMISLFLWSKSDHDQVEKWGIRAETITAKSVDDLATYLREKKSGIAKEHLTTFQPYLNGNYVLVVAWIESREQVLKEFPAYKRRGGERRPCLFVEFTTERAFYPLRPTRLYGNHITPVRLFVVGHVQTHTAPALTKVLRVSYREQLGPLESPPPFAEGLPAGKLRYTRIQLDTAAEEFTDDLYFSPLEEDPPGVPYARLIESAWPGFFLLLDVVVFLALSYVSAGLSGLILFRRWKGYAVIGLANLLTIVGVYVAIRGALRSQRLLVTPQGGSSATGQSRWRRQTEERRKAKRFSLLFTLFFVLGTIVLQLLLRLPLYWS
jgi:hypothetical protein